jgi:NAD(P)H-dependent flavin oxidoreductase YrpB (nitropropane dioxygenase family)
VDRASAAPRRTARQDPEDSHLRPGQLCRRGAPRRADVEGRRSCSTGYGTHIYDPMRHLLHTNAPKASNREGHGSASSPPVLNLVPQILSALPPIGAPPVLAAGGLSNGAHLAAFLTLGAAGAVVGTRFLFAQESIYSDVQKRAIIAAKSGSSVRSYVFDELRNTTGWPAGTDGRALAMPAVAAVESGADIAQIKEEVAEGAKRGDPSSVIAWAGTGVGQPNRLQPAKVTTDYLRSLKKADEPLR